MLTLIKNGHIFGPDDYGKMDILIAFDKLLYLGAKLELPSKIEVATIDASGHFIVPGFIDQHVHIGGGGGEGGPASRTPEITIHRLVEAGITTVVGLQGFDGTTRGLKNLLVKARSLEQEGITTFIYTGAYEVPTPTITGSIKKDLILIDKVIGCGEIALSDHRSSYPDIKTLARLGNEAYTGGLLGNKAGIIHIHVGEGKTGLTPILKTLEETDLPMRQFIPTHVNRTSKLFTQALDLIKKGGHIDLTAGFKLFDKEDSSVCVPCAVKRLVKENVELSRVTVSSDGNGSLPRFDQHGHLVDMDMGKVNILWQDVREIVVQNILPLDRAVGLITKNVASLLKLRHKGKIKAGADADLVILDKSLNIKTVIAKGKVLLKDGKTLAKDFFINNG